MKILSKWVRRLVILVVVVVVCGACSGAVGGQVRAEGEPIANRIAADYVSRTRRWAPQTYEIQFRRRQGDIVELWIVHEGDADVIIPGEDRSFVVYVDIGKQEVIEELAFQ